MASPDEDRTPRLYHAASWTAGDAAIAYALAVATFLLVGVLVGGLAGLVVAEVVGLLVVPVAAVLARGLPLATLGLVRPTAGAVAGAALVGAGLWLVAAAITAPWAELIDPGQEAMEPLEVIVEATPIAAIVALSIIPAVCEEIATRGLLLLGLRPRLGVAASLAITTAAFALLHFSLVRAVPTAILGLVFGVLTLRTGSVVPAIVAHALNNGSALLVSAGLAGPVGRGIQAAPAVALAIAAAMCATGLGIAWRATPGRS